MLDYRDLEKFPVHNTARGSGIEKHKKKLTNQTASCIIVSVRFSDERPMCPLPAKVKRNKIYTVKARLKKFICNNVIQMSKKGKCVRLATKV